MTHPSDKARARKRAGKCNGCAAVIADGWHCEACKARIRARAAKRRALRRRREACSDGQQE